MKLVALVLATAALLSGCGTINTVFRDDAVTQQNLTKVKTYCGAVPRVYSGVMYNFCSLNAPQPETNDFKPSAGNTLGLLVDMGISGVLDTLALPYTIVRQSTEGSIEVR